MNINLYFSISLDFTCHEMETALPENDLLSDSADEWTSHKAKLMGGKWGTKKKCT